MARRGVDPKVLVARFGEKAALGKRVLMGTKPHRSCVSLWRERSCAGDELAVTGANGNYRKEVYKLFQI